MSSRPAQRASSVPAVEVSALAVAWFIGGALFLALRVATVWQAPVAASEFAHLSGAWNATVGVDDVRFVPTLFQSLTALLLNTDASEVWPRVLAFAATCTIPFALYRLRPVIGEGPALVMLVLLALSAPLVGLGASASAHGFDVAITLWLAVAVVNRQVPVPVVGLFAFLVATAGPLPAALALAFALVRLARADYPGTPTLLTIVVGALAGVFAASVGFGWGWQGIVIPPVMALTLALEHEWASAKGWQLLLLYGWPLAAAGVLAFAFQLRDRIKARSWQVGEAPDWSNLALAWFALDILWCIATLGTGTEIPLAGLSLSAAAVVAIPSARLIEAIIAADWRRASLPVGLALFFLSIAGVVVVSWARFDNGGPAGELLLSAFLVASGVALLLCFLWRTPARDSLENAWFATSDFAREAWDGDWRNAALAVIAVLAGFALVAFAAVTWASGDSTGRRGEAVVVAALVLLSAAIVAGMLAMPRIRAAAAVVVFAVVAVPFLSGAMLIGLSGPSEPLNSPVSTFQGRNLRDIAVTQISERGGAIVVHDSLRYDITWPFRESGDIVIATNVPADATIVIWPTSLPAPPGLVALDGPWSLVRTVPAPTDSFLRYVRWFADRNYLAMEPAPVAVYGRASE